MPAATVGKPFEPAGRNEGRQHAAVAIGSHGDAVGGIEEEIAGGGVDGWQITLPKDEDVVGVEAAVVVVGQPRPRVGVGRGAGHDRQRHPTSIALGDAAESAEKEIEERCPGERADRHDPLRTVASQARALPTGHEHGPEQSRGQALSSGRRGPIGVVAEDIAGRGGGPGEIGRQSRCSAGHHPRPGGAGEATEFAEHPPVDGRELTDESVASASVEGVPEPEDMILTGLGDRFLERCREGRGVHGDLHSGAAPDPRPEQKGKERKTDENHAVGEERCPEMLGPASHGGVLPEWGGRRIVDRREGCPGEDVDGDENRLVGWLIEPAFDPCAPGENLGRHDRRLDLLAACTHLDLGKVLEWRAESDVPGDQPRAGNHREMEGATDALHPLVGEDVSLEPLLEDPRHDRCRHVFGGGNGIGQRLRPPRRSLLDGRRGR